MPSIYEMECAKRKRWLPKPPSGKDWRVHYLRNFEYEVVLVDLDTLEYTKVYREPHAGKFTWWLTGKAMILLFDRDKVASETADEFVARMNSRPH